jgi:SAM-dependent methyltransferase
MDGNIRFYDDLARDYRHIFQDWEKSVEYHADAVDAIVRRVFGRRIKTILDASCGIGTQLIGLARRGYEMTGSDISGKELAAAGKELKKRKLKADLRRADFRDLSSVFKENFDLVISCDNSVPHCLSDEEILKALKSMYSRTRYGVLLTIRDYDNVDRSKVQLFPYGYRTIRGVKTFLFQRWEFEGDLYTVSFFFVRDDKLAPSAGLSGKVYKTKYYAVKTGKMAELMKQAGFRQVQCLKRDFYQPILVGLK